MAFLGVLLGIVTTVLAFALWYVNRELGFAWGANERRLQEIDKLEERIIALEKKPIPLDTKPTAEKIKLRAWSEDIPMAEAKR